MLSSDHLFPLQEVLDLLYQRRKIMEPAGGSLALSESRSETMRRLLVRYLLTLQDSVDLCSAWCENAVLGKQEMQPLKRLSWSAWSVVGEKSNVDKIK